MRLLVSSIPSPCMVQACNTHRFLTESLGARVIFKCLHCLADAKGDNGSVHSASCLLIDGIIVSNLLIDGIVI